MVYIKFNIERSRGRDGGSFTLNLHIVVVQEFARGQELGSFLLSFRDRELLYCHAESGLHFGDFLIHGAFQLGHFAQPN